MPSMDSNGAAIMPSIIGVAMRRVTSERQRLTFSIIESTKLRRYGACRNRGKRNSAPTGSGSRRRECGPVGLAGFSTRIIGSGRPSLSRPAQVDAISRRRGMNAARLYAPSTFSLGTCASIRSITALQSFHLAILTPQSGIADAQLNLMEPLL